MNRKPTKKVIHKCYAKDWDFKTNRIKNKVKNSAHTNNFLSEEFNKAEKKLYEVRQGNATVSTILQDKEVITLHDALQSEMNRFKKEKKTGAYKRYEGYQKQLAEHFGSKELDIRKVNLNWYQDLAVFLANEIREDGKVVKKKNNGSVVQLKIKVFRRLIETYSGTSPTQDIKKFKVTSNKPVKQKLNALELLRIEQLDLSNNPHLEAVRDLFLLQVYLRGARVGSILMAYPHQFKDGRYTALNSDGKKNVSAKLIPKAQAIVDKYIGKHERLFPLYEWQPNPKATDFENKRRMIKKKEASTTIVNKLLKRIAKLAEIDKPLSSHIARHTYARMAINKVSNPMQSMELLGHSTLAIHQGYLADIRKDDELDDLNDDIFS